MSEKASPTHHRFSFKPLTMPWTSISHTNLFAGPRIGGLLSLFSQLLLFFENRFGVSNKNSKQGWKNSTSRSYCRKSAKMVAIWVLLWDNSIGALPQGLFSLTKDFYLVILEILARIRAVITKIPPENPDPFLSPIYSLPNCQSAQPQGTRMARNLWYFRNIRMECLVNLDLLI